MKKCTVKATYHHLLWLFKYTKNDPTPKELTCKVSLFETTILQGTAGFLSLVSACVTPEKFLKKYGLIYKFIFNLLLCKSLEFLWQSAPSHWASTMSGKWVFFVSFFPALLKLAKSFKSRYLRCIMQCFDMDIHCEIIATIKLINIPVTSHCYLHVVRIFKVYF